MLASVYTDDEERGQAIGIALGGLALGVLGRTGSRLVGLRTRLLNPLLSVMWDWAGQRLNPGQPALFAPFIGSVLHSWTSLRQRDVRICWQDGSFPHPGLPGPL